MKDFAGNTLANARKLGNLDAKTLTFKDFVGSGDRNDLYTFSVGSSSGLNVNFSGAIAAELFALKNRKALKKIGKIDFNNLKQKDIRNHLIRVARSGKVGVPQIMTATLAPGDYYLRVRSPKNKTNYNFSISSPVTNSVLNPVPNPNPAPVPNLIPNPVPVPGITTLLFNGTGLPKTQGWLDFNQIPFPSAPLNNPPFLSSAAKFVVQTPGATGVTFKTDEDFTASGDLNKGYAGYSNYTATAASVFPLTFKSAKVNPAFPMLDRAAGYILSFKLAVNSEISNANRAGFSLILNSEDAKGIELGFKSDRIFAQSSTFTESENAVFSTNTFTNYKLAVKGDGYELFANNASILKGALRTYQFDPATSNPPLPASPYALPSFLFLGDNTDQGRANVTLGAIDIIQG
ncbi:MAG: hypothetical protein HC781_05350 [Leptolyngbyaceae cyanobacterium CSU_1_4]|nr:hypothetical protein [Leptolyngbyaceae cyanobacterium CSU_1_4]